MKEAVELALRRAHEHAELVAAAMRDIRFADSQQAQQHVDNIPQVVDRVRSGQTLPLDYDLVLGARAFFLNLMHLCNIHENP